MGQGNPYIGAMILFAGNFAPRGWAFCEGQLLSINQHQALFSLLGTIYGGDGRTTFALPDLRGRGPISSGTGPGLPTYREGQRSGQSAHTLTTLEMPAHNHTMAETFQSAITVGVNNEPSDGSTDPDGNHLGEGTGFYNGDDATGSLEGVTANVNSTISVGFTGGTQQHNNMQPFLAINYIIALQGIFPSRS
ncbi:MAG: phage tail protein [Saprospiraceae bacterium]